MSTIKDSEVSFDPDKSEHNSVTRGLPFSLVTEFEWADSLIVEDVRRDYGELRFLAIGCITGRLHVIVFTPRANKLHVISLRKANQREIKIYAQKTKS